MGIYANINNHRMMNNEDIINIVNYRLKELKLYKKSNNVVFSNEKDLYFRYGSLENIVYVTNNYKILTLKTIINDKLVKPVKKENANKSTFLVDSYNLELLTCPYHELRHAEQYEILINNLDNYNILINKSLSYMNYNLKFYYYNHPRFLSEHDAELNAYLLILSDIEKGKINICLNSLYYFNANIAHFLLRSRGFEMQDNKINKKSIFKSPLHMLYFYNKSLYLKKEINREESDKVNNCILKIRKQNKSEYDRIISGDSLSEDTINELFLIASGKMKIENIFTYFENKELDKNNNHCVKKLILFKE